MINNKERNEKLANEIKDWLVQNGFVIDNRIYFNGKCFDSIGNGHNDDGYRIIEDIKPSDYFEYANDDTVSMSFEGELYDLINYEGGKLLNEFNEVFSRNNCYFELGHAWNLSVEYL